MKKNSTATFTQSVLFAAAAFFHPVCVAQSAPAALAEEPVQVTVRSVAPLAPVAPAWQADRTYKFGDLASYDGVAYKAKSGSAHRRPDPATEIGWEKMNDCGDKSKGAVKCEIGNQVDGVSVDEKDRNRDDNIRGIEFNAQSSTRN